ncbi:MAG TPA: hypothetical protein VF366_02225 [Dehalococcoidia bacterium]
MLELELVPTLSQCIETVAAKRHDETVRRLLASGKPEPKLFETEKLLRSFLETADFKKLRAESESLLTEGQEVKFLLRRHRGILSYEMLPVNRQGV